MFLRRSTIVKYSSLGFILWIVYFFAFGKNHDDTEKLEIDQNIINRIVEKAQENEKRRHEKQELIEKKKNIEEDIKILDRDHPLEERLKAEEQSKNLSVKIQLDAPEKQNINSSPGICVWSNKIFNKLFNIYPGELGKGVIIDKDKLSPEERIKYDKGWENNAFNQYVSDMISLHRSLADIRDPA